MRTYKFKSDSPREPKGQTLLSVPQVGYEGFTCTDAWPCLEQTNIKSIPIRLRTFMSYCIKKTETEEVTRYFINTYSRTPYIQNRHD